MGEDTLSHILLSTLILLIGYVGNLYNKKLEKLIDRMDKIIESSVSQSKDIEYIREDVNNHELRLASLEKRLDKWEK